MGLTGVIYAAIVVAWAAFLVPLALYRHDQAARTRSIERFSSAMRVLARSGSGSERRVVVVPTRAQQSQQQGPVTAGSADADVAIVSLVSAQSATRPTREALASAARRRRRVLCALLVVTLTVCVMAASALLPWWSAFVPVVLIAGFLSLARRSVRRSSEAYWEKAAEHRVVPSNVVRRAAARTDALAGTNNADDEQTVILIPEQVAAVATELAQEHVVAVSMTTSDGGSLWDPLPVTLPTYVDKQVARRTTRTIDLGGPGTWSAGHSASPSQAATNAPAPERGATDAEDDSPRVVNG